MIPPLTMEKSESNDDSMLFAMINGLCDEDDSLGCFDRDLDWQSNLLPLDQIKVEPNTSQSCFLANPMTLTDNFIRPFLDDDFDDDFDDDDDDCKGKDKKRKRTRPPNPDAKLIAEATERNLKLLNLDPNSKEGKKQRRKIRNRMSAQLHRERKKAYIDTLEAMVRERNAKILELQEQLRITKLENECLRGQLNVLAPINMDVPIDSISSSNFVEQPPIYHQSPTTTHSALNSDNYDSDGSAGNTSTVSTASYRNSPSTAGNRFPNLRAGLSLFSIVMMFGLSFFNRSAFLMAPSMTLDSTFTNVYEGSSIRSVDSSLMPPMLSLPSITVDATDSYLSDHHSFDTGNGRVLLSTSYTASSSDSPINSPGVDLFKAAITVPKQKIHSATSTALWKYQDRIVQLFPHEQVAQTQQPVVVQKNRRNLRARSPKLVPTSARALVVAPAGRPRRLSHAEDPEGTLLENDVSHVVMTQGRALLDKSLITTTPVPRHVFPSDKASPDTVLPSWTGRRNNWPTLALQSSSSPQFDALATSLVPAPLLVMLLPASVVRWGKTWGEGSSYGPLEDLLKEEAGRWGDQGEDGSSLWVEIACTVVSAQIVRNVTLV